MYLAIDAAVLDMPENLLLEKIVTVLVELVRRCDQWRQPMLGVLHPATFAALERRIPFFGERVFNVEPIEGGNQPLAAVDFVHTDAGIELFGNLSEDIIAFAQQQIARLLGRRNVDTNTAPTHPVHHRQ